MITDPTGYGTRRKIGEELYIYASGTVKTILHYAYSVFHTQLIVQLSGDDAHKMCCSIGMKLVSFEAKADTQNLRMFLKQIGLVKNISRSCYCLLLGISGSAGIWINAVHTDCHYRFKWCGSGGTLLRNDSRWQAKLNIMCSTFYMLIV
jgi:hypothetical protein